MKLSLIALAASTAMVSAHDYGLPPPAHYPSVESPPPVHTPTLPPPAHYPSVEYPPPVHTPSLPPPAHYPSVVYPPPPPPPVHTPSSSHSYSNITLIPTKTIYPPHPPPSTTTIPPPPPEGCPPVKTETVTTWINPPPTSPTHPSPEEPGTPGEPEEPEEPEQPGESGGEQPPATQSGPETVPTGAAMACHAPVALLAAGVLAAIAF